MIKKNTTQILKDRATRTSCAPEGKGVPAPYVAPVVLLLLQIR